MKRRIFAFGRNTYREFLLEADDAAEPFRLDGRLLGTAQDLSVSSGGMCTVRSANNEKFLVTAAEEEGEGIFWYDELPEGRTVRIGKYAQNDLELSFFRAGEYISGEIAQLCRSGRSVQVSFTGRNVLYLNGQAAGRSFRMERGDHLHIWGTDLVWTGNCMAVRTERPVDRIRDRLTQDPDPEELVKPFYERALLPGEVPGTGSAGAGGQALYSLSSFDLQAEGDGTYGIF